VVEAEKRPIDPRPRSPEVQRTSGLSTNVASIKVDGRRQDKKNNPVQVMCLSRTVFPEAGAPLNTSSMGFNASFFFQEWQEVLPSNV